MRMRPPRSALANSCVSSPGGARPACAPRGPRARPTSSNVARAVERTTTWKPFEPDVFTQLVRPSSSSTSRSQRRVAQHVRLVARRIEVEHAQVGLIEAGGARDGHTCSVMLFWFASHCSERAIVGQRVVDRAALLRRLDALQPRREALAHVLLDEPLAPDAVRKALHRDRRRRRCGSITGATGVVVRRELALGDAVVGEQHLLGMRDHARSLVGPRAPPCRSEPSRRGWRSLPCRSTR